ncbi:MAG TPA: purine-nucleoside phosphorylase [Spirochaetales bacterium]|nr:purine-nucleoside phosphorylase [Spirochaetales bacterium]
MNRTNETGDTGYEAIGKAAEVLAAALGKAPRVALVLGSGLGGLADEVSEPAALSYADIPGFPVSTAPGHAGRFVKGKLDTLDVPDTRGVTDSAARPRKVPVVMMQGRFHCYEGWDASQIAFPIRVLRRWGVEILVLTNAAGGVNLSFHPGDFMLIRDHINLSGRNPLVGSNDERIGPRFTDMTKAYDPELRALAHKAAGERGIALQEGVYAWFLGPSFETPAEIKMARTLGADAVGMSTVPEVIAAVHCGMRVLGISCITNMAAGILDQPITGDEVIEISRRRQPDFSALMKQIVRSIVR